MDKSFIRRALIKGALAAPAVLTVRSASATARTSAMVCIARDAEKAARTKPAEMVTVVQQGDNFVRRPIAVVRLSNLSTQQAIKGKFFLGPDGCYWQINDGNPMRNTATRMSNYTAYSVSASPTGEVKHVLEYFDHRGHKTGGWGWERKGGHAMTRSCHTSFALKA